MSYKFIKLGVFPPQVTKERKGSGLEFCPKSVDNCSPFERHLSYPQTWGKTQDLTPSKILTPAAVVQWIERAPPNGARLAAGIQ